MGTCWPRARSDATSAAISSASKAMRSRTRCPVSICSSGRRWISRPSSRASVSMRVTSAKAAYSAVSPATCAMGGRECVSNGLSEPVSPPISAARSAGDSRLRLAMSLSPALFRRRVVRAQARVPVPGPDQEPLEARLGLVKGGAPAGIGLAVEVAVIGLVDAGDLFARLPDQRGVILPPWAEARAQVDLHQRRHLGLLGAIVARQHCAHRVPR